MNDKDVSKAIQAKSDQLNADDLLGGPITIKIRDVNVDFTSEQPISVFYDGDNGRPWKPCKTAARCLAAVLGANAANWIGLSCTIYNDTTVTWAGAAVGGVRVSHIQGLEKTRHLQLAKTRGKKSVVTIHPLVVTSDTPNEPDKPPVDLTPHLIAARDAASKGTEDFRAWWKSASGEGQTAAKSIMDELKKTAADVDALAVDDEIPM